MKIQVDFRDVSLAHPNHHIFVETLLIDQRGDRIPPFVYQLTQGVNTLTRDLRSAHHISLDRDCFLLMGELGFTDKKLKQVTLIDQTVVSYQYLVIALEIHGKEYNSSKNEFITGLQTLVDALRLKEMVRKQLNKIKQSHILETKTPDYHLSRSQKEEKMIVPQEFPLETLLDPPHLDTILYNSKRLFEVQL